ncbi:hypothetical protein ACP4OV_004678 [Aristida adscensionis]
MGASVLTTPTSAPRHRPPMDLLSLAVGAPAAEVFREGLAGFHHQFFPSWLPFSFDPSASSGGSHPSTTAWRSWRHRLTDCCCCDYQVAFHLFYSHRVIVGMPERMSLIILLWESFLEKRVFPEVKVTDNMHHGQTWQQFCAREKELTGFLRYGAIRNKDRLTAATAAEVPFHASLPQRCKMAENPT